MRKRHGRRRSCLPPPALTYMIVVSRAPTTVPEQGTIMLLGSGLVGLVGDRRKRQMR